jgi:hypothetical protein
MEEAWIFWGPRIRHFAKKKSQQHGQGTVWTFFFKKLPHFKEEIYEMAKLLGRFGSFLLIKLPYLANRF